VTLVFAKPKSNCDEQLPPLLIDMVLLVTVVVA